MNIIKNRVFYISVSCVIILVGLAFMFYNQSKGKGLFNYDIQFTGGTSIEINLGESNISNEEILKVFTEVTLIENPQVQRIGDGSSIIIKTKSLDADIRGNLVNTLSETYSIDKSNFSTEDVSATISSEMKKTSIISIISACLAILIYVSIRFKDFKFGASSILALLNDALILIVFYGVFRIPLNNTFIAALLTVLGYSINSSIIIFDRVRENKNKNRSISNEELINRSVKQTLKRSIFTSLTTFFTVFCLYIFGVESVKVFALPVIVGIVCGTYTSIFIAGSIWYILSSLKPIKR